MTTTPTPATINGTITRQWTPTDGHLYFLNCPGTDPMAMAINHCPMGRTRTEAIELLRTLNAERAERGFPPITLIGKID